MIGQRKMTKLMSIYVIIVATLVFLFVVPFILLYQFISIMARKFKEASIEVYQIRGRIVSKYILQFKHHINILRGKDD